MRALLLALSMAAMHAFSAEIAADFLPLVPQPRPTAPEWVEIKLASRGAAVREGALNFELRAPGQVLCQYRTHDLAFTAGTQRYRFLLPPATRGYPWSDRSWRISFIGRERTIPLGDFAFPPALNRGRSLVLAIVRGSGTTETPMWQALRLEQFAPTSTRPVDNTTFSTTPAFLDLEDLPSDPLGYCAFDAVLLEGDALPRLREKTRIALGRWVRAGGSLAVVAARGLEEAHLDFLNALGQSDPRWQSLAQLPEDSVRSARADFGSLLVTSKPPPSPLTADWRQAVGALWKLRAKPLATLATSERWNTTDIDQREGRWDDFQPDSGLIGQLTHALVPQSVRPLPIRAFWGILIGFVIVVGPLDWFGLGLLRRRRLTWIVFPAVALLATFFTVVLARHYLGSTERNSSLIITDLGTDGRVVRETRIDLCLPAQERELITDVEAAIAVPIPAMRDFRDETSARTSGQFPARYRLIDQGRQWSPALTRVTSLTPADDASGINWDAFEAQKMDASGSFARGTKALGASSRSVEFYRGSRHDRAGMTGVIAPNIRDQITHPRQRGALAILSQLSPSGSPVLDDLGCIDLTSEDRTIAIVTVRTADGFHIWRRLFLH